jgi:transposase-like protein
VSNKRYSVEQIVAKLREAEKLQGQGLTIAQVCKRLGISDQTFFRWRIKYGALKEDEAQRLKAPGRHPVSLEPPEALDPLAVHPPALTPKQRPDPAVAVAG